MLHALALTTFALAVVGAYAAVFRDVPILNALNRLATPKHLVALRAGQL